ncbi:hypothetical protein HOE04_02990 [archaeon]|jgi:uncharacterized membrane protein|nr:hypothetical protein [archaeon]
MKKPSFFRKKRTFGKKKTKLVLSLFILSLISLVSADVGDGDFGCFSDMGGMMGGSYGWSVMGFGWLISLLVVVALVLLIIWLIKQINSGGK